MAIPLNINNEYEKEVLAWIKRKATEGIGILRKERAYNDINTNIDYINGEQFPLRSRAISKIVDNRLKKVVQEVVSGVTDVRPIFNYDTFDDDFKDQGIILNKLARGYWTSSFADRKLYSALMYSCVGGSGYLGVTYNPLLPGGGDIELIPLDPRNVIPIEPVYSESVQDWRGVIIRQRLPIETVKRLYPDKGHRLGKMAVENWFGPEGTKGKLYDVMTTVWSIIKGRTSSADEEMPGSTDFIRVYLKDDAVHTGDMPIVMGEGNNSYIVYPIGSIHPETQEVVTEDKARLYPRGRCIVCTPETILYDGPNPYWHGMFPLVRFTLDPFPWSLLGSAMVADLVPLQNALNEALRGADDAIAQWIRRGVVADKNSVSPTNLSAIDTRKAGMKVLVNPTMGEGFKLLEGPQLPDFYMALIQFFKLEIDENSGVKDFKAMMAMKQNPTESELEKYHEALSPLLRGRSRSMEVSLKELAEMLKVCFFQYYDAPKRIQMLGLDGLTLEDFDYDPNSLVPDSVPGVGAESSRVERASEFHRNFKFNVATDSFLNVSHTLRKMMILQLFRTNGIDIYSMWKAMDLADTGPDPAETIPERMVAARRLGLQPGPTPEMVQAQEALMLAQTQFQLQQLQQMQMMQMMGAMPMVPPGGGGGEGGPPEGGPPGAGGGGAPSNSGVGPQGGRPPSGNQPPQMLLKDGGTRPVISESGE